MIFLQGFSTSGSTYSGKPVRMTAFSSDFLSKQRTWVDRAILGWFGLKRTFCISSLCSRAYLKKLLWKIRPQPRKAISISESVLVHIPVSGLATFCCPLFLNSCSLRRFYRLSSVTSSLFFDKLVGGVFHWQVTWFCTFFSVLINF